MTWVMSRVVVLRRLLLYGTSSRTNVWEGSEESVRDALSSDVHRALGDSDARNG
jgi:hypothetical protein